MSDNEDILLRNIDQIKKLLRSKIYRIKWLVAISGETVDDLSEMAISHIWENLSSYNENYDFVSWAVKTAIRRTIDQYKIRSYDENIIALINKIAIELQAEELRTTQENIVDKLEIYLGSRSRAKNAYSRYSFVNKVFFSSLEDSQENTTFNPSCSDENLSMYEWSDFKSAFIKKLIEAFEKKEITKIQLDAILNVYLPLAEDENRLSFVDLAKKYKQSKGRISQILSETNFRKKITQILRSLGLEL